MEFDPELIRGLEANQLTVVSERPLPRRKLGPGTVALLIVLRVYVIIAIPIVGYAFVHALLVTPR